MRRLIAALASLAALGVVAVIAVALYGLHLYQSPGPLTQEKTVMIARGAGVNAMAETLAREGVLDTTGAQIFPLAARLSDRHTALKAGEYAFAPGSSVRAVLDKLAGGDVVSRAVTLREGLTSWQVFEILRAEEALSGTLPETPAPEGSLLPETYHFISGDDRNKLVVAMQDGMKKTIEELWPARADGLPFTTPEEALILASVIEKETGKPEEHRRVAGVFVNRLRAGMPLQTDPTVIYALTMGKMQDEGQGPLGRRLLRKDLEVDSPYNTYRYPGLPPGPICNPGRASIEAALNPEQHDYLYFVADGTGGHVFARTLAEHNNNVASWRTIRKNAEQAD